MTIYYVDSDVAGPGSGTFGDPWDDIASNVNSLSPGDEIKLRGSSDSAARQDYAEEITISANGSSGSPIVISTYNNEYVKFTKQSTADVFLITGDYITLDFTGTLTPTDTYVTALNQCYCEIDHNLERFEGITVTGDNVTVKGVNSHDGDDDHAILFNGAADFLIESCRVYTFYDRTSPATQGTNGITIGNVSSGTVRYCQVYDCAAYCVHIQLTATAENTVTIEYNEFYITSAFAFRGEGGIAVKTGLDCIIRNNILHGFRVETDRGGAGGLGQALRIINQTDGVDIYDNEFYDLSGPALSVGEARPGLTFYKNLCRDMVDETNAEDSMIFTNTTPSLQVWNNTFVGDHGTGANLFNFKNPSGTPTITIKNNIFDATASNTNTDASITISNDYNAWGSGATEHWSGANDVTASDLGFTDEGSNDYTLLSDSPCIDEGVVQTPYTDGYSGSAPDIGAFQFSGGVTKTYKLQAALTTSGFTKTYILESVLTGGSPPVAGSGISAAKTRVSACTAAETQNITVSNFGTPKAALFVTSYAVTDAVAAQHAGFSIGAGTASDQQWAYHINSEDGQGTTDSQGESSSNLVIILDTPGAQSGIAEAQFKGFIDDGVQIEWTTAPSSAYLIDVYLFGGTSLSARADYFNVGNLSGSVIGVSDPQFEPNVLFTAAQDSNLIGIQPTNVRASYGLVHNDGVGGITQRSIGMWHISGEATANISGRVTESFGIVTVLSNGTQDWGGSFGSFAASGFSVTTTGAGNDTDVMYLALGGLPTGAKVVTVDTPTSTGSQSVSSIGFSPQLIYQIGTLMEATDTAYSNSACVGGLGFGGFSATAAGMTSIAIEQGVSTTDTQSLADDKSVNIPLDSGATGIEADFSVMSASGYTLDYTAVTGVSKKFIVLGIANLITSGSSTYTLQSALKSQSIGRTYISQAVLLKAGSLTNRIDAILKTQSNTLSNVTQAILKSAAQTNNYIVSANIKDTTSPTYTLSANLKSLSVTKTAIIDAILKSASVSKTFTLRGKISGDEISKLYTLRAVLKSVANTDTFVLGATLKGAITATHILQSLLKVTNTVDHQIGANLKASSTSVSHVQSATLKGVSTSASHILDSILKATTSKTNITGATLKGTETRIYILSAHRTREGFSESYGLFANLKATTTKTFVMFASLSASSSARTISLDAILKATTTNSYTLQGVLKSSVSKTHIIQAGLRSITNTTSYALSSNLQQQGQTLNYNQSAILKSSQSNTHIIQGVLEDTISKTYSLDANLKRDGGTLEYTFGAGLKSQSQTKEFSLNSIILSAQSSTYVIDATLFNPPGQLSKILLEGNIYNLADLEGSIVEIVGLDGKYS